MADAPDSPEPSRPAGFPSPDDLRGRDIATVDPPKTDAAAVGPAPPSAGPYRLSGPSDVARGVRGRRGRGADAGIRTEHLQRRPAAEEGLRACRRARRFGARDRNRAARRPDRGGVRARRAPVDAGRRLPHQLRPDGRRTRRDRRRARAGAGDAADRRTRTCETRGPVAWAIKGLKVFGVDLAGELGEGDRTHGSIFRPRRRTSARSPGSCTGAARSPGPSS